MKKKIDLNQYLAIFFVLFFSLLSVNIIFGSRLNKELYLVLECLILLYVLLNLKYITKKYIVILLFFVLPYLILSLYFVPSPGYHAFYGFSLILKITFLFIAIRSKPVHNSFYLSFRRLLFLCIALTLAFSIVHMLLGIYSPAPGWLWPINISIQELTLLILFCVYLSYRHKMSTLILILMFFILLSNRGSGKTALGIIMVLPVLMYLSQRWCFCSILLKKYTVIYSLVSIFSVAFLLIFHGDYLSQLYAQSHYLVQEKVDFYKRLTLILESIKYISLPRNFVFGGGLGTENYLRNVDSILGNTPQIFVLTVFSYGGLILFSMYMWLLHWLISSLSSTLINKDSRLIASMTWFAFLTFLTTHEYFNNPFLYSALFVVIVLLKSRDNPIDSYEDNKL